MIFTIHVNNHGWAYASNIDMVDTRQGGVTFLRADSGCTYASGKATCPLARLDNV